MYAATTGSTANGHIYFKSLNNEIISKVLESDSTSLIYTTQQNIDFDEELVSYIKEKNKTLTIKYINNDVVSDQVTIRSDSLDNDTKSFKVTFTNNEVNPYMDQIKAVFGKYVRLKAVLRLKRVLIQALMVLSILSILSQTLPHQKIITVTSLIKKIIHSV